MLEQQTEPPPVVCICGSGRFWDEMARQRRTLTLERKIVVGPEVRADNSADADIEGSASKPALDEIHLRKIDISNEVLVVDIDTNETDKPPYTGPSTQVEIAYAKKLGLPVTRLSNLRSNSQTEA
jgi:hypothetical protein